MNKVRISTRREYFKSSKQKSELKNIINELNNSVEGFNSRLGEARSANLKTGHWNSSTQQQKEKEF